MRNKLPKWLFVKSSFGLWRIISYVVIGFVIGSIIVSAAFINRYVYQTLEEANSVVVLKSGPDLDLINDEWYERGSNLIALKNSTSTPLIPARNVFVAVSSTAQAPLTR